MVFNGIVSSELKSKIPAFKKFGYLFPFAAVLAVGLKQNLIVFAGPLFVANGGVEVIMPPELLIIYLYRHCFPVLS